MPTKAKPRETTKAKPRERTRRQTEDEQALNEEKREAAVQIAAALIRADSVALYGIAEQAIVIVEQLYEEYPDVD